MIDLDLAVSCTRVIAAIGLGIGSAEYLAISPQFSGAGVFSDSIYLLDWLRGPKFLVSIFRVIFSHHAAILGHSTQVLLAALLLVPLGARVYSIILLIIFILQLHSLHQTGIGRDGSDQMLMIVMPSLAVAYAFRLTGQGAWIALWFIVAQSLLAYMTSGVSKLISPVWRSGNALELIFNTAGYGSDYVNKALRKAPALAWLGAWSVIVLECGMPLALVVPKRVMLAMLFVVGLFHLGCALTMGLNCFLWAFMSTYPLIYLCNVSRISAILGVGGTYGDRVRLLIGGAVALAVVINVLIRYYELFPRTSWGRPART